MKTAVVIPTLNESKRIKKTLSELVAAGFDVIVVDDGSTDNTKEIINELPVRYVEHILNRGQGAALKTGTDMAIKLGYDSVAHFDADGQHRLEDLKTIIDLLEKGEHDVVLGSRFMDDNTNFPWQKKIILNLAKIFSEKILQLNFTDPQSGLRAFRLNKRGELDWKKDDFQHCTEILTLILKNKLNYKEVPIIVKYNTEDGPKVVRPKMSMGVKLIMSKIFD